jgi:superfamily I DNA/RNA helicase
MQLVFQYLKSCEESGIQPYEVCIAARTRTLYKAVQDEFHRLKLKYNERKNGSKIGHEDGISLCTLHSLKGLEYRVMILIGVDEKSMPSQATSSQPFVYMDAAERKDYLAGVRSLLYVAITRARQAVFIIGYGQPTGLLEISK